MYGTPSYRGTYRAGDANLQHTLCRNRVADYGEWHLIERAGAFD